MPSLIWLDMESSLVIELEIACVDNGIFCWTNPCRKLTNSIRVSQEMNSHRRWSKAYDERQQLCTKDTVHSSLMEALIRWTTWYLQHHQGYFNIHTWLQVSSDNKVRAWGRKADSSKEDLTMLFLFSISRHYDTLVCNPSTHCLFKFECIYNCHTSKSKLRYKIKSIPREEVMVNKCSMLAKLFNQTFL